MDSNLIVNWPGHHQAMNEILWNLLKENYKVDVELSCSGITIKCHQLILAMFLPKFKEIFQLEGQRHVSLDGITQSTAEVDLIIEFIYRGKISVPEANVENLMAVADMLGIKVLVNAIEKCRKRQFLQKVIDEQPKATFVSNIVEKENIMKSTGNEPFQSEKSDEDEVACKLTPKTEKLKHTKPRPKSKKHVHENCEAQSFKRCPHCTFRSRCQGDLEAHVLKHDPSSKRYKCDVCSKRFSSVITFKKHSLIHGDPDRLFSCSQCDFRTTDQQRLEVHLNVSHKIDGNGQPVKAEYRCDHCDFVGVNKIQLSGHVSRKHKPKNCYKCDECEYTAVTHRVIARHISMVHRNERPYMCEVCGARQKSANHLQEHMRAHEGLKPHKCNICNKNFARVTSLKTHMRLHSGIARFTCNICGGGFQKRYRFAAHLQRQHNLPFDPEKGCKGEGSILYPVMLTEEQEVNVEEILLTTEHTSDMPS